MTPQENKGERSSGDVKVELAIRFLEEALVAHGPESDKGKELFHTIGSLRKAFKFHDQATEVLPAELKAGLLASADSGAPQPVAAAA